MEGMQAEQRMHLLNVSLSRLELIKPYEGDTKQLQDWIKSIERCVYRMSRRLCRDAGFQSKQGPYPIF